MINLITGLPGHGKSLFTLWHVKNRIDRENAELIKSGKEPRQVFYNGIPELTLDWQQFDDPEKWHELPTGSVIVIDECQRTFRPRGSAAQVPLHVSKLETHRHQGMDLYVITQHPMLIDGNVRRLVDRHYHVHRPFGWSKSTVLDFQGCKTEPMNKSNRQDAQKTVFVFPKELYSCYKSAEVHTAKARLPGKLVFLILVPFILAAMGWYAWNKISHLSNKQVPASTEQQGVKPDKIDSRPVGKGYQTKEEWIEGWQPRLLGLQYTAPRYDEVTKPVRAPFPAACIEGKGGCKCYTQQATLLDVDPHTCHNIVERGYFQDFDDQHQRKELAVDRQQQQPVTQSQNQPDARIVTKMDSSPDRSVYNSGINNAASSAIAPGVKNPALALN